MYIVHRCTEYIVFINNTKKNRRKKTALDVQLKEPIQRVETSQLLLDIHVRYLKSINMAEII